MSFLKNKQKTWAMPQDIQSSVTDVARLPENNRALGSPRVPACVHILGRTFVHPVSIYSALPLCQARARYKGCSEEQGSPVLKEPASKIKRGKWSLKCPEVRAVARPKATCQTVPTPDLITI